MAYQEIGIIITNWMATNNDKGVRVPPNDLGSEKALLGSIMLDPELLIDILDMVPKGALYARKHNMVYDAMRAIHEKGDPIDLVSLTSKLTKDGNLETIGGSSYLTELVNTVPSAANALHYADVVARKKTLRTLIHAADHISEMSYNEATEVEDILDKAGKKILDIATYAGNGVKNFKDTLHEAMERLEHLQNAPDEIRGVPSGFKDLDSKLAGFQKADMIILAARPSMGKTTLALDIARATALDHKTPVGIFSLEMSASQLVDRMLASESRVDSWKLRTGKLSTDGEFEMIREALGRLQEAPIYIDDDAQTDVVRMRSVARKLKREHNIGLLIVDYLQLLVPRSGIDSVVQQVSEISRSLKGIARELDIPVLALSQLNRQVEQRGGKPRLSDLRDSGCLAGDTLITRADTGERIPISQLVGKSNVPVYSLDDNNKIVVKPMLKIFSSGKKKVFELKTKSGRTIKASANHPFYTVAGWKRLDELSEDSAIAIPRRLETFRKTDSLSRHEAILLAHLLGDGCVLPRQPIHYTSADIKNIEIVGETAKHLFGITPRVVPQNNWWHIYLPSPYRLSRGTHHPITNWYQQLGLERVRSYEKRLPQAIFSSSLETIAIFLHHLWATDGNISWKIIPGRKRAGAIYYGTTSKQLSIDVQHLLLRLGIQSSIRVSRTKDYRPSYNLHVEGSADQLIFCKYVGSHGERGAIVPSLAAALSDIKQNPNTDSIPQEAWQLLVKPAMANNGVTTRGLAKSLGVSYNGSAIMKTGIGRSRLTKIAHALKSDELMSLASSDIYWDKIISITPLGTQQVYDATVPDTHNFVADDFIVHNSIEQDADVVMFIHREANEGEGGGKSNTAEIMIEKHRNGPTGTVPLYFDEKRVSFNSIEKSNFGDF